MLARQVFRDLIRWRSRHPKGALVVLAGLIVLFVGACSAAISPASKPVADAAVTNPTLAPQASVEPTSPPVTATPKATPTSATPVETPTSSSTTSTATSTATTTGDLDCRDFSSWSAAQAVLDSDPSDPNRLDADHDGIACEALPGAPDSSSSSSDSSATSSATSSTTGSSTTGSSAADGSTSSSSPDAYYANCTAARAAGAAPLHSGDPGYRAGLDRDGDGVACE